MNTVWIILEHYRKDPVSTVHGVYSTKEECEREWGELDHENTEFIYTEEEWDIE